jgi:hypothetical protein
MPKIYTSQAECLINRRRCPWNRKRQFVGQVLNFLPSPSLTKGLILMLNLLNTGHPTTIIKMSGGFIIPYRTIQCPPQSTILLQVLNAYYPTRHSPLEQSVQ